MNRWKFSVIIPVYNKSDTLSRCLDSIIEESYDDYEIVLVDDGSTDDSGNICDEYAAYENISVIHKSNGGCIDARREGICLASGEYIVFVDADDFVSKDYMTVLHETIEEEADLYILNNYIDRNGKGKYVVENDYRVDGYVNKEIASEWILCGKSPVVWNKIYRSKLMKKLKIEHSINYGDDIYINILYLYEVDSIYLKDISIYYYQAVSSSSICANQAVYKRLCEQRIVCNEAVIYLQKQGYITILHHYYDAVRRSYAVGISDLKKNGEKKADIRKFLDEHEIVGIMTHGSGIKDFINYIIVSKYFYCLAIVQEILRDKWKLLEEIILWKKQ